MARSHRVARTSTATLLLLVILGAGACGGAGSAAAPSAAGGAPLPAPSAAPGDPGAHGSGGEPGRTPVDAGGGDDTTGRGSTAAFGDLAKIVYDGTLSLQVKDLETAVRAARAAVLNVGGYVAGSRRTVDETRSTAAITYRIPAARWEATLETLRSLGTVLGEEIEASEVTAQIVDLEARIRNLRVSEQAIQGIAAKADTFEKILDGEARLAEVRGEIERLDAQRASLEDRADLGTLTVAFGTEAAAVVAAVEEAEWDAGGEVARATETLLSVLRALTTAAIWLTILWLPVIALIAAGLLVARLLLRRVGIPVRIDREAWQTPRVDG